MKNMLLLQDLVLNLLFFKLNSLDNKLQNLYHETKSNAVPCYFRVLWNLIYLLKLFHEATIRTIFGIQIRQSYKKNIYANVLLCEVIFKKTMLTL